MQAGRVRPLVVARRRDLPAQTGARDAMDRRDHHVAAQAQDRHPREVPIGGGTRRNQPYLGQATAK
ncbi:hypothetical protein SSP24_28810 [Streptomyces spinoverrucosus]|uniref:Uncharacterized protein n=1 Tax=Streptomyces spinoverrucosus TaxID=284043 RepID=A0A4Y3VJM0_9ACTN|nr:hypothetical protein SSP24_28810 [Streptomyces spinoverrucosus]GHB72751.1 hypothetical protein GCM10010397_48980 [Streptomyces spinoverrucosus]